ncbi:MAG: carboxylating nicotinate-nucleotide diphosphorylase, partial [Phycisphaerales bacterium]
DSIKQLIQLAKDEDFGSGDVSAALLPDPFQRAAFDLVIEQAGVFAGRVITAEILHAYDETIEIQWSVRGVDGEAIESPPTVLATIRGPVGAVLSAERVLLNFLQRLSGIATETRRYVNAIAGTDAAIFDTRKTIPGWRALEKYAVQCGGGQNHRMGLYDAVMIKDNHLADVPTERLAGVVFHMLDKLLAGPAKPKFVTVEADTLEQVEQLFKVVGIDIVLLDNFSPDELRRAVQRRDACGLKGKVALEASGGITLESAKAIAETGVERLSVGAITHSATACRLKLERVEC